VDPISVAVTRGGVVEARHRVHAVVVRDGAVAGAAGNPSLVAYLRSSAKPLQAVPLLREAPDLPEDEIAIACASHEARPEQLAAVRSLLERALCTEDDLECGPDGGSRLRHNCSGKHAGMLVVCRRRGLPLRGYHLPEHPLQRELLGLVAEASGVAPEGIPTAADGCGVVTFALPLERMAAMFETLGRSEPPEASVALAAMRAHPELVGGPGAIDTRLMRALPGTVAKRGAEGLVCGVLPDGRGFALKAEDGEERALAPAAARFLGSAELLATPLTNSRGEPVGQIAVD
jgi:L-asparaginase II